MRRTNTNNFDLARLLGLLCNSNNDNVEPMDQPVAVVDTSGESILETVNDESQYICTRELEYEIQVRTKMTLPGHPLQCSSSMNLFSKINQKDYKQCAVEGLVNHLVPQGRFSKRLTQNNSPFFVGQFSKNGKHYVCASQDKKITFYDTETWKPVNLIKARNVGWTVSDVAISPDNRFIIYSSWNPNVFLCNIESHTHIPLNLINGRCYNHICHFSIRFSHNSSEILSGSSDNHLYLFDINEDKTTFSIEAHEEDINAVEFVDESSQLILSGSDDHLIKLWDKRQSTKREVGVFIGHLSGITHIKSKDDGRYFISNSKDQTIKLWDLRKWADSSCVREVCDDALNYDYRYGDSTWKRREKEIFSGKYRHVQDSSLMTYHGAHTVFNTLIRCYFSPDYTSQQYIYTGSADGAPVVYDIITGRPVVKFNAHVDVVRDISWNPNYPQIATCSWDGTVRLWDI